MGEIRSSVSYMLYKVPVTHPHGTLSTTVGYKFGIHQHIDAF